MTEYKRVDLSRHIIDRSTGKETRPSIFGLFDKSLSHLNNRSFPANQTEATIDQQRQSITKYLLMEVGMKPDQFVQFILQDNSKQIPPYFPLFILASLDLSALSLNKTQLSQIRERSYVLLNQVYKAGRSMERVISKIYNPAVGTRTEDLYAGTHGITNLMRFVEGQESFFSFRFEHEGHVKNYDISEVSLLRGLADNSILCEDTVSGKRKGEIETVLLGQAAEFKKSNYKTIGGGGHINFGNHGINIAQIGGLGRMPINDYRLNIHFNPANEGVFFQRTDALASALDTILTLGYPITVKVTSPDDRKFPARYCVYCDIPTARKILDILHTKITDCGSSIIAPESASSSRDVLYPFGVESGISLRASGEGGVQNSKVARQEYGLLQVRYATSLTELR